jgi:hypothetical protein
LPAAPGLKLPGVGHYPQIEAPASVLSARHGLDAAAPASRAENSKRRSGHARRIASSAADRHNGAAHRSIAEIS